MYRQLTDKTKFIFIYNVLFLLTHQSSIAQWIGFQNITQYPSTMNYYVLTKDINNDNYPDIITANVFTSNSNSFGIRINDGTGHLLDEVIIPIRSGYTVWDFADLDKDGWTDMLSSYYWENGIRVYMGSSVNSFAEGELVSTATHGWLSKIYDTDSDGNLDLVSISHGSGNPVRLHIFKGKGDGTFSPKLTYESQFTTARNLNIKDINQDGLSDIVLAGSFNKIPVFIQNPDHSFTSGEIPVEHGESFDNAIGDINNDGIPDIVYGAGDFVTEGSTDTIRITLGNGNGVFKPSFTTPALSSITNPIYIRLADLNLDSKLDIITFDYLTKNLYYFLGNGDRTFVAPEKLTTNDAINKFEVSDVNLDGFPDIITVNKNSTLSVLLNKGVTTNIEEESLHSMLRVYPNPFNEFVTIELSLPVDALVKINILDVYGRKTDELVNDKLVNQTYRYHWHSNVLPGIYLLNVAINEKHITYKLIKY